jgi:hypothetical protein
LLLAGAGTLGAAMIGGFEPSNPDKRGYLGVAVAALAVLAAPALLVIARGLASVVVRMCPHPRAGQVSAVAVAGAAVVVVVLVAAAAAFGWFSPSPGVPDRPPVVDGQVPERFRTAPRLGNADAQKVQKAAAAIAPDTSAPTAYPMSRQNR